MYEDVSPSQLVLDLKNNILDIHYDTLQNERVNMRATLMSQWLPPNRDPSKITQLHEHNSKQLNAGLAEHEQKPCLTVFDLNSNGWRSVRIDRIRYIGMSLAASPFEVR